MRNLGQLLLDNYNVPVVLIEAADVRSIPLDERVLSIASHMRSGEIVVCELGLLDFLSEEDSSERARIRKAILKSGAELLPAGQSLADSIEDVGILALGPVPPFLSMFDFETPAIVFVPQFYLDCFEVSGSITTSVAWKANTIDVFDLVNRFEAELKSWQLYDSTRLTAQESDARAALASALGIGEDVEKYLAQAKEEYLFGYAIGEAVGNEHSRQWLPMDLKLEHFLWTGIKRVIHVDHSNDVFLLREPTVEECAKSIAPLYQQMSYPLWHAFREGYWDTRHREALDVFLIFDDWVVGEILGVRAVANAVKVRDEHSWQAALAWCDDAQTAFYAFREGDQIAGSYYLARLKLVRGDIYLLSQSFGDALINYDSAQEELELLKAQGVSPDFHIVSALINSAYALTELERRGEARDRLIRAKMHASKLPSDDPGLQFLGDTASKLLDKLRDCEI